MSRGHERSDMNPKYILYFGIALVVAGLVIQVGVWGMFRFFEHEQAQRESQPALVEAPKPPPEPRLQVNPRQDLADLRAKEDRTLNTYGWVDRNAGVVRIPIDEAIRLILQRGLPARPSEQTNERNR